MPATIINRGKYFQAPRAFAEGDKLWITAEELPRATGWELKPQGFCLEERCVPIPRGREAEFRSGDLLNLAAMAKQTGQPLVRDDDLIFISMFYANPYRCVEHAKAVTYIINRV